MEFSLKATEVAWDELWSSSQELGDFSSKVKVGAWDLSSQREAEFFFWASLQVAVASIALLDQGHPFPYTLHGAHSFKDRGSRP